MFILGMFIGAILTYTALGMADSSVERELIAEIRNYLRKKGFTDNDIKDFNNEMIEFCDNQSLSSK